MNVLLSATTMSFQLLLVQLSNVFMVLREIFLEILICAPLIALIIQVRRRGLKAKALAKQTSSLCEKYHEFIEQIGEITKLYEELRFTAVETSPPMLQTLCLVTLNKDTNRFLSPIEDLLEILDKEQKCESPRLSFQRMIRGHCQGQKQSLDETFRSPQWNETGANEILKSSQQDGEQCQEEILENLEENAHLHGTLNLHALEDAVWNERVEGVKEQMNEKLTVHSKHLENEQGARQQDNEQLGHEIEKLQHTLQVLPEVHQHRLLQLHRESVQQESVRLGMEINLTKVYKNIQDLEQQAGTYRKMAEELEKEMESTTSYHQRWIRHHERNSQENFLVALAAERKLIELRQENEQNWQKLREREHKIHLFPRGPLVPTFSHAAQGGWRGSGQALHHQDPSWGGGDSSEGSEVQGDALV